MLDQHGLFKARNVGQGSVPKERIKGPKYLFEGYQIKDHFHLLLSFYHSFFFSFVFSRFSAFCFCFFYSFFLFHIFTSDEGKLKFYNSNFSYLPPQYIDHFDLELRLNHSYRWKDYFSHVPPNVEGDP